MRSVRVLVGGLTITVVLSEYAAGPVLPLLFLQKENEKLLLAEKAPIPALTNGTRSNHSADLAAAWGMLPRGSAPVRF